MKEQDKNLSGLYPFLYGRQKDAQAQEEELLDSIVQKARNSVEETNRFIAEHAHAVLAFARATAEIYGSGGRLFTMGNGGSSCDASHFAVEFQHPITAGRPPLPTINLVMDTAMITAVGNDVGLNYVFSRPLESLARPGDGLVGFSTSGNSTNLIEAYRKAKEMDITTFGLSGGDGGLMRSSGLVDHLLCVETASVHRVQEVHVVVYHIMWDIVHTLLSDGRGRLDGDPRK